jgi:hypothetical protein
MDLFLVKRELTKLGIKLMFPKHLQHQPQLMSMLFLILRINKYVIQEHNEKLIQIVSEYSIH